MQNTSRLSHNRVATLGKALRYAFVHPQTAQRCTGPGKDRRGNQERVLQSEGVLAPDPLTGFCTPNRRVNCSKEKLFPPTAETLHSLAAVPPDIAWGSNQWPKPRCPSTSTVCGIQLRSGLPPVMAISHPSITWVLQII